LRGVEAGPASAYLLRCLFVWCDFTRKYCIKYRILILNQWRCKPISL